MRSLDLNKEKSIQAPDSWKFGKLSDIALITMGQSPPGDTYNSENKGIPMLNGPTEFTNYYPIPIQFTTRPTKISKPGDILYCVRGSSTGRMNFSDREYCIGRGLASIRQKANSNTKYIYYILTQVTKRIFAEAKGAGSTFPNISRKGLEKTNILIPPIDEQNKITEILFTVDDAIEKTDAIIKETQQLKKGLMEKLFTGGIRHKRFKKTKIGRIPEEWEVKKFQEVMVLQRGFDLPVQNRSIGEYPILASNGIIDYHNEFRVKGPGIITGRSGTLGNVHFIEKDYWPLNTTLYVKKIYDNNPKFLYYFLQHLKIEQYGTGTGVPTLNRNVVHKIQVILPSLTEQIRIAEILSDVDNKINNEQSYKSELEQLKKGLLQVLLTGKVRVKV